MKSGMIKQGTKVTWTSAGRGGYKTKTGKVECYIEPGKDVRKLVPKKTGISRIKTRYYVSSHRRYLVLVLDHNGIVDFYTPRATTIHGDNGYGDVATALASAKSDKKAAKKSAKKATAPAEGAGAVA